MTGDIASWVDVSDCISAAGLVLVLGVGLVTAVPTEASDGTWSVRDWRSSRGFVVLGSATATFGGHAFTIVALGKRGEDKRPWSLQSAAARPLLLFERRPDGSFQQVGRNDHVVLRANEGGQCDPFLDGGGVIAVTGRFFTVQNGVACGQHWTDYITFRFDERRGRYVFDNERFESWSLNSSNDPSAEAMVRDGPARVDRGDRMRPVPFDRWRPAR